MNIWIIPSSPDVFDVERCLMENSHVYWRQKNNFQVGDIVFIYCSGSVGKIRFVTIVDEVNIPNDDKVREYERPYFVSENESSEHVMLLRRVQSIQSDDYSRPTLLAHGLRGNIQGPQFVKGELFDYMVSHLSQRLQQYILSELRFDKFDSWVVLSENKIVKFCDRSWFEHHGSGIPQEVRWYWGVESIQYPEQKQFSFRFNDAFYEAKVTTDNASGKTRTRLFWNTDCSVAFNKAVKDKSNALMLFEKEGNNIFKASFINDYTTMAAQEFNIRKIINAISASGLIFDPMFVQRYVCALLTKPFVILSGLTGSGKTQLAMAFPKLICESESQYKLIPVGADWTNREQLLGYPDALHKGQYVLPDNGALQLILEAAKPENQHKPYFLVLDEMNMSYVERYFADFLSAMESGEAIPLWEGNNEIPASVKLPKNLFIIGTINVDETTYMFSPKVLDRANVLEFRINKEQMLEYLDGAGDLTPLGDCSERAADFVEIAAKNHSGSLSQEMKTTLIDMFDTLGKIQKEFGYRTAHEMSRFITITQSYTDMSESASIDSAIVQKLLPKVHGSRKKVSPVLKALWTICYKAEAEEIDALEFFPSTDTFKYPLTAEKVWRMFQIAQDNGFTSYAEA